MHKPQVIVVGGSGYVGVELTRLLSRHGEVDVRHIIGERWQGERVGDQVGIGGAVGALRYSAMGEALERAEECAVALLATPVEVSLKLVPELHRRGVRAIDLSGAFRLKALEDFRRFYGLEHPAPGLVGEAVYGLPELQREGLAGAGLVANPGCYPTAVALALAPLLERGLLDEEAVVVNAASGTTGAGRKGSEELSFSEVDGDFRAYKVLGHQHTPEIVQTLARAAQRPVPLTFTAHLLPVRRGILVTACARARPGVGGADLLSALHERYRSAPFVQVRPTPEHVCLSQVVGTNQCHLSVKCDPGGADPGRVVVLSAIDNLVKGAAGQALQNLNLMLGLSEEAGLRELGGVYP